MAPGAPRDAQFNNTMPLTPLPCPQVLDDVTEIETLADGGKRQTKQGGMLLNGNQVAMLIPHSSPEDAAAAHAASLAAQAPAAAGAQ